jgi:hypothetical protein
MIWPDGVGILLALNQADDRRPSEHNALPIEVRMHTNSSRISGLIVLSLGGTACVGLGPIGISGNGQSQTEERQVGAFDAITVSDALTAMITLASDQPQSVQVSGDSNLVPLVRATVSGSELTLDLSQDTSFSARIPLVVTVSAQALHALKADTAATAIASAMSGDDLSVESSSSAMAKVASITAANSLAITSDSTAMLEATHITAGGSITLTAADAANATVSGTTPLFTAHLTRSANLQAQNLSAVSAVITASVTANAQVCATTSLKATLTIASKLGYHCNPASVIEDVDLTSKLTKE